MKNISEIVKNQEIANIIDWELHPYDAVTRYLEWGNNWSRGLNHAKSCNEESAYFKIDASKKPAQLLIVRQSHHDFEIISEIEAPRELIEQSVQHFACNDATCGLTEELRMWLKKEANISTYQTH